MDNFKAIYKILSSLEAQMDLEETNIDMFGYETVGVSKERWTKYLLMLAESGYVGGVSYTPYEYGGGRLDIKHIRITIKGLEYLQENTMMKKAYRALKGIKETIPGI